MTHPASNRLTLLNECQRQRLDIVIIGGGITGAGILRDAAMRGLRVALFEREDFGAGTSSRSSKLVHGGLRYLETFDFRLVFEACRERRTLLNIAPRLVRPLAFLYPVYKGHPRSLVEVASGVWLYDLLSTFRTIGHPKISLARKTLTLEPALRKQGLSGSALFYDAVTHDTALTLANVESGWRHGGLAMNHVSVVDRLEENGRVTGVVVRDEISGTKANIHARWVVNAAGPWGDDVRRMVDPTVDPRLRPTKGVHLVLPKGRVRHRRAILMRTPSDGRVAFIIPWAGATLVGTTDTDYKGDPALVSATDADVDYLLDAVNHYFPEAKVTPHDVVATFAGLRPLLRDDRSHESAVSREHQIFSDRPGFVTIAGGKLTTFRQMALEVVDWLASQTPEWSDNPSQAGTDREALEPPPPKTEEDRTEIIQDSGITWGFIRHQVEHLQAATVTDVLAWRSGLAYLDRGHALKVAAEVAQLLARQLKLTPDQVATQLKDYLILAKSTESGLRRAPVLE